MQTGEWIVCQSETPILAKIFRFRLSCKDLNLWLRRKKFECRDESTFAAHLVKFTLSNFPINYGFPWFNRTLFHNCENFEKCLHGKIKPVVMEKYGFEYWTKNKLEASSGFVRYTVSDTGKKSTLLQWNGLPQTKISLFIPQLVKSGQFSWRIENIGNWGFQK